MKWQINYTYPNYQNAPWHSTLSSIHHMPLQWFIELLIAAGGSGLFAFSIGEVDSIVGKIIGIAVGFVLFCFGIGCLVLRLVGKMDDLLYHGAVREARKMMKRNATKQEGKSESNEGNEEVISYYIKVLSRFLPTRPTVYRQIYSTYYSACQNGNIDEIDYKSTEAVIFIKEDGLYMHDGNACVVNYRAVGLQDLKTQSSREAVADALAQSVSWFEMYETKEALRYAQRFINDIKDKAIIDYNKEKPITE